MRLAKVYTTELKKKIVALSDIPCLCKAVDDSKPYIEPTGDLISREALKEHKVYSEERHEYVVPVYNIDNAQAIPLPNEQIAWEQGYEAGLAQGKQGRTKGEWTVTKLLHGEDVTCPFCNARPTKSEYGYYLRDNFCHECGADMRKGVTK